MTSKSLALESMREELLTSQKLLKIQMEENYKANDHIMILDAEINSLKELTENKQLKINKLKDQLLEKDAEIRLLNSRIEDSIIEKKAFDKLDGVNNLILFHCREKDKEIEQLQLELKIERDMKEDKLLYEHNRIKEVAATEIILTSKLSDLQHRYEKSQLSLNEKTSQVEKLSDTVRRLKKQLEWNMEMRLDQVGRSRESEYRTMSKLEDTTLNYYKVLNDKETLERTVQVQSVRGDLLQDQLNSSTEDFEKTKQIFSSIVDAAEHSVLHSAKNERALTAENRSLQVELNLSKLALDKVVKSHRKAHQITPFDRSVEHLLSQSMPAPMQASSTSNNATTTTLANMTWTVKTPSAMKKASEGTQSNKRLTPLVTAGDRLLAATFPRDRAVATVSQQEDDILTDVGALKHRMMTKYFTLLAATLQPELGRVSSSPSSHRAGGKTWTPTLTAVDLCQCELRDDDFKKVVEWLRILPLASFESVDLKNNYLTGGALTSLFVWLLSLSAEDTLRSSPLLLDLKHNLVTESEVKVSVDFITSCLEQSEFSLVTSECDGRMIFVYAKGAQQQSDDGPSDAISNTETAHVGEAQLFCKVDVRFQRQRSPLLNTTSRLVASSVHLQLDPTLTLPASAISEDKVLPASDLLVFPRESVLNGMVME